MLLVNLWWRPFGRHFYIVGNIMKRSGITLFLLRLLVLLAFGLTTTVQADGNTHETSPATIVSYDRVSDHLTVTAEAVSLKFVLGRIARQSGIEVLFDDQADEPLTINIQSDSLEEGLKRILRGKNHILRYNRDDTARLLVIGVMVLPVGEQQDSGRAKRLVGIDKEAYYRARSQLSLEQVRRHDMTTERWQARLDEMPPEFREKLEMRTNAQLIKRAQREKWRAEKRKKDQQKRAEYKAERQAQRELDLSILDPEQRAVFEKNSEAARERMRVIFQEKQY